MIQKKQTEKNHLKEIQINRCIQQNHKIISLIKRKLTPLHPTQFLRTNKQLNLTTNSNFQKVKKEQQIIPEKQLEAYELMANNVKNKVLERTKKYLSEKKKAHEAEEEQKKKSSSVSVFLRLFEEKQQIQQEELEQLLKMKKEINRSHFTPKAFMLDFDISKLPNTSEEQNELMNAKLRQKLNHKKIIGRFRFA